MRTYGISDTTARGNGRLYSEPERHDRAKWDEPRWGDLCSIHERCLRVWDCVMGQWWPLCVERAVRKSVPAVMHTHTHTHCNQQLHHASRRAKCVCVIECQGTDWKKREWYIVRGNAAHLFCTPPFFSHSSVHCPRSSSIHLHHPQTLKCAFIYYYYYQVFLLQCPFWSFSEMQNLKRVCLPVGFQQQKCVYAYDF